MERFVLMGAMIYDLRVIPYQKSEGMNQPIRLRGQAGGVARNAAEKLAALGHHAILVSACGLDMTGKVLMEDAIAKGIDISYVKQLPSDKTSGLLVLCDEFDQPVSSMLDAGVLNAIDHLYLYTTMQDFTYDDTFIADNNLTVDQLQFIAHQHAQTWLLPVADKSIQPLINILPLFQGVQFNERMLSEDLKLSIEDLHHTIRIMLDQLHLRSLLLIAGENGIYYADPQCIIQAVSPKCKVLDQTSAYEIVLSAFLTKILQHMPIEKALEYALCALLLENEKKHEKTFVLSEEKIIEKLATYQIETIKEAVYVSEMY